MRSIVKDCQLRYRDGSALPHSHLQFTDNNQQRRVVERLIALLGVAAEQLADLVGASWRRLAKNTARPGALRVYRLNFHHPITGAYTTRTDSFISVRKYALDKN